MAIRKTNDIANEADSKYSNQRGKRARIEERLDDTTHNDNPYDDAIQYISKKIDEVVDELNLSDSSKVITSAQASAITANTAKVGFVTTMPTSTANHTVSLSVTNSRGAYALVFTMVDSTDPKNPVTKTSTIPLK